MFCLVWKSYFGLVRSTKIEAPLIGLWPKPFSVTVTHRLGLMVQSSGYRLGTGSGYRVYNVVSRVHDRGFRVQGRQSGGGWVPSPRALGAGAASHRLWRRRRRCRRL